MPKFVALLRGINVGGNKKVPMKELKTLLEKHGFKKVKTLLASGNVVFEAEEKMLLTISGVIEKHFGFPVDVITLPHSVMQEIVRSKPFEGIKVTPKIRLYVTFSGTKLPKAFHLPYTSEDGSFMIIQQSDQVLFSVLNLEKSGTVDAMKVLEKEFGKNITTRNYNTVEKIALI